MRRQTEKQINIETEKIKKRFNFPVAVKSAPRSPSTKDARISHVDVHVAARGTPCLKITLSVLSPRVILECHISIK
jgi:hypothetical protein